MKKTAFLLAFTLSSTHGLAASDFNMNNYNNNQSTSSSKNDTYHPNYDKNLLEIEISDTRGSTLSSASISSTTIMTRADIKNSGAQSMDQLLQQFTGINVSRTGGESSLSSINLRGAEADTTLILLNNIRIQSLNTGFSIVSDLPISSIEKIEVIRGAQSSLYGSASPGGTIKIFTIPEKQRSHFSFANSASDQGDLRTSLGGTSAYNDFMLFGSGNWSSIEGTNACANISSCYIPAREPDIDGVERINGQIGFQFFGDSGASIQFSQLYNNARNEFDGFQTNESETTQKITSGQISQPIGLYQNIRFDLGHYNELSHFFLDSNGTQALTQLYGTERSTSSVIHEIALPLTNTSTSLTFISGLDFDHSSTIALTAFPKVNRQSTGIFSEAELALNGATIRLGARRDKYDEYHTVLKSTKINYATTGHLKLMFDITDQLALKTSLGRTFNMPTFNDLYFPIDFGEGVNYSNANFGPETHVSQEIGIEYAQNNYNAAVFFFRTKSKDLISYNNETFSLESIGEALIRGVEFSQTLSINSFQLGANFTFLNATNTSDQSNETKLPRRPTLQFSGHASYQMHNTQARLGVLSSGRRYDDVNNAIKVGGHTTYSLSLTQKATQNLSLGLRVDNLFDKEYQTVFGYNQPDRNTWINLEYAIH